MMKIRLKERNILRILATGASLLLLFSAGCMNEHQATEAHEHAHESPAEDVQADVDLVMVSPEDLEKLGLRVEEVERSPLVDYVLATGIVQPDESRVARIRPLAQGVTEKVFVRRGDRVEAGDPLVQYDNIELGEVIGEYLNEHVQLHKDQTGLEVARKVWERGMELYDAQAISKKEAELREAQYKNAQATVDRQRAVIAKSEEKLHRFGFKEEEILKMNEEHTAGHRTASLDILRSPLPGVVIEYDVAPGEVLEPSRELMTVADLSHVWVLADIYVKDLGNVSEGQAVEVVSPAYPGEVFHGQVTYISDVLQKSTRTVQVRCVLPNPNRRLKLEMFVEVRIPLQQEEVLAVPDSALQEFDGMKFVFVEEGRGHFRRSPVRVGRSANGLTAVIGLEEKTPVVTEGSFFLKALLKRNEIGDGHGH